MFLCKTTEMTLEYAKHLIRESTQIIAISARFEPFFFLSSCVAVGCDIYIEFSHGQALEN